MALRCAMDGNEAWTVSLLSDEAGVSMASSLMDAGAVDAERSRRGGGSGADVLDAPRCVRPGGTKLTAVQFAGDRPRRGGDADALGNGRGGDRGRDRGRAGGFLSALAGIAEGAGGATWLTVSVEPDEARGNRREAPRPPRGGRACVLVRRASGRPCARSRRGRWRRTTPIFRLTTPASGGILGQTSYGAGFRGRSAGGG
jgi:hypothetical protein